MPKPNGFVWMSEERRKAELDRRICERRGQQRRGVDWPAPVQKLKLIPLRQHGMVTR